MHLGELFVQSLAFHSQLKLPVLVSLNLVLEKSFLKPLFQFDCMRSAAIHQSHWVAIEFNSFALMAAFCSEVVVHATILFGLSW